MITLALDLATKTGFAIYTESQIIAYGYTEFNGKSHGDKLSECYKWLVKIMSDYKVSAVVAEDVYIPYTNEHKNINAFKLLSEYHGILEYLCFKRCLPYYTVTASQHHQSLLGYQSRIWNRNKIKEETIKRVNNLGYPTISDDTADAISMLCYWCKHNGETLVTPNQINGITKSTK